MSEEITITIPQKEFNRYRALIEDINQLRKAYASAPKEMLLTSDLHSSIKELIKYDPDL